MELILQQNLPHQQNAVDAVCNVLNDIGLTAPIQFYENPKINLTDERIIPNIKIQQDKYKVPVEHRSSSSVDECLHLDIKMETGTGKTYVYTKTIYELHRRYGFNKFIIVVPSLAIKAGTAQFIQDAYATRHFKDVCSYSSEIELGVLEPPKNKKKGRSYFPGVVSDFIKGSCQNTKKIYVLLTNMQLLTSKVSRDGRNTGLLWRDDYDYSVEGFYCPLDALCATRPVVIIDEPHRFSRDQLAYKTVMEKLKPQAVIRYGATFPRITTGKGKNKPEMVDYQHLLYDLNACQSFNLGLIKGVAKEHFEPLSKQNEKVKILSIASKDSVTFQLKQKEEAALSSKLKKGDSLVSSKSFTLKSGDALSIISNAFEGVSIQAISKNTVEFSNGVVKNVGEEMDVDVYMSSYQREMVRLALERHFETERENFSNRSFKIKTLALFFIDDISSYRPNADGKEPYLRKEFEILLKERIEATISKLNEYEREYREYLEASLANIEDCHAGYFSQDNNDSDECVAKEIDMILNGKKELLSFRKPDGSFNTLRFLFSKWTLKEGWDNPNVFTIAKLRSSGSENSKLQEVGRGLRLPVDENGNRISNEKFFLNYIVDFTEADFAQRLVNQINEEIPQACFITENRLSAIAQELGLTEDQLFNDLYSKHFIDWRKNILLENRDRFLEEYPQFAAGISSGKIIDRNKDKSKQIKIRKDKYGELRELWERINQRYILFYDSALDTDMESIALSLFENPDVFTDVVITSKRDVVSSDGHQAVSTSDIGVQYTTQRSIPYGLFLSKIMRVTNIPITVLHNAMVRYSEKHGNINPKFINENSIRAFCAEFQNWKTSNLQGRFHYKRCSEHCGATALSYADGSPKENITQGRIGTKMLPGTPSDKYLYDAKAYDSPLEAKNIAADIDDVVVYGKIPRSSIAIPTIAGGTYSPDFMYVVEKADGKKELNIIVETKGVENKSELRGNEKAKIECAKVFFENLSREGYTVHFHTQINNKQMKQIIDEVLRESD